MVSTVILVLLALWQVPASRTFHVNNDVPCIDGAGGGTEAKPYCSLKYVAGWAMPGDTFLIGSKRDGSGPAEFTRSGTATAPITYKSTVGTVIGSFKDVKDEDFQATSVPHVFTLVNAVNGPIHQTFYPPVRVVDDNSVNIAYDMLDEEGPLQLANVADDATLARVEGSYRWVSGVLSVHPYGNLVPSTTDTDFVMYTGRAVNVASSAKYLTFDGFTIAYGGAYTFQMMGSPVTLKNIKFVGTPLTVRGSVASTLENISITHVHIRDATSKYLWGYAGSGTAGTIGGSGNHKVTNLKVFKNWNSSIGTELATGVVTFDGVWAILAPNHCGVGTKGRSIITNSVMFGCQDYQWVSDFSGMVIEHSTMAGLGIGMEAVTKAVGTLTVRHSIMKGDFRWVRGLAERCTWEAGSVIENNVFHASATIEHCADMKTYTHADYKAKCESGILTGCATFRNNRYVTDWKTVLAGGMWFAGDTWDVSPVAGGPAVDIGAGAVGTDITGLPRPQGQSSDAGAYEFLPVCICPPAPVYVKRPGM